MAASRAKRAEVASRRARLIQARLDGRPYEDIYRELGYASRYAASRDFSRALEENITAQRTSIEVYRETELMRLDQLTVEALNVLRAQHYHVTQGGRIVEDPHTGRPLLDDAPVLAAIDRLVRIGDRRAKLLGLDSPQRVEVLTLDALDAQIAELNEQLAAADRETDPAERTEASPD